MSAKAKKLAVKPVEKAEKAAKATPGKPKGRCLQEFREAYDRSYKVPFKIREGLKRLGNSWCTENDFMRNYADVSSTDLAAYRDQFEDHIVLVERTKRVWSGSKQYADKLREMVR